MKTPLGKLERIPLRKAWAHEAGEFTPWLSQADNLNLLAEQRVGRKSAAPSAV